MTGLAKVALLQMRAKTMAQESRGRWNRNILIETLAEPDQDEGRAEMETCRNAALLAMSAIETIFEKKRRRKGKRYQIGDG